MHLPKIAALTFAIAMGAYHGLQGVRDINAARSTQVFSDRGQLEAAMTQDANGMAAHLRLVIGQNDAVNGEVVDPVVDVDARRISIGVVLTDIDPMPFGDDVLATFKTGMKQQSCPTYRKTVMALNNVEMVQTLYFSDRSEIAQTRINPEVCATL